MGEQEVDLGRAELQQRLVGGDGVVARVDGAYQPVEKMPKLFSPSARPGCAPRPRGCPLRWRDGDAGHARPHRRRGSRIRGYRGSRRASGSLCSARLRWSEYQSPPARWSICAPSAPRTRLARCPQGAARRHEELPAPRPVNDLRRARRCEQRSDRSFPLTFVLGCARQLSSAIS